MTHIVIFSGRDKAINSRRGSVRCVQRPCGHGVLPVAVQPATNARTRRFAGQFDGTRSPGGCTIDRSNRHRKLSGGVRVPPGAHGYAYARRHRTSSARPPLSLWPVEAEGPAARGHRMVQARGACPNFPRKWGRYPPKSCILTFLIVSAMYIICNTSVVFEAFRRLVSLCILSVRGQVSVRYRLACLVPSCAQYSIHAAVSMFLDTERYKSIHDQSESPPQRLLCVCIDTGSTRAAHWCESPPLP